MDRVFIEDLRIETTIGIYDWEKKIRQVVAFDIEMAFDNRRPAASDRIEDTLDYKAVSKRLKAFVGESKFELVETPEKRRPPPFNLTVLKGSKYVALTRDLAHFLLRSNISK